MDNVTQSNAAKSEETASASQQLFAQADQMKAIVQDLIDLAGRARHQKADRLAEKNKAAAGNSRPEHAYRRPFNEM